MKHSVSSRVSFFEPFTGLLEIIVYLLAVAVGSLCFVLNWLTVNGAVILCVGLLLALILLSWNRFAQGRHPCFLFLCTLTLMQGGRLLTYSLGYLQRPMRGGSFTQYGFDLSRDEGGMVLLCIALSAICVYAPCRWNYRFFPPTLSSSSDKRYLSYLYFIFLLAVPLQLLKSYAYYEYIQGHGGYVYFFINHAAVASSIPFFVRAGSLIALPVFVAIFVLETKRKRVYVATALYFISTAFILLIGLRGGLFALVLALWYAAGIKSRRKTSIAILALVAIGLILVGDVVQTLREDSNGLTRHMFAPITFVMLQGNSIEVTEAAVKYQHDFAPYSFSYLTHELENAFVSSDVSNYFRGKSLAFDVPVLLDSSSFSLGHGTGGSYIGEAYVLGGVAGVVLVSLLIGAGLQYMYHLSERPLSLVVVGLILPEVLIMPRGNLLDWLSVLLKYGLLFLVLYIGWLVFGLLAWLRKTPRTAGSSLTRPA